MTAILAPLASSGGRAAPAARPGPGGDPAPTWQGPPAARHRVAPPRPSLPVLLALVAAVALGLFSVGGRPGRRRLAVLGTLVVTAAQAAA